MLHTHSQGSLWLAEFMFEQVGSLAFCWCYYFGFSRATSIIACRSVHLSGIDRISDCESVTVHCIYSVTTSFNHSQSSLWLADLINVLHQQIHVYQLLHLIVERLPKNTYHIEEIHSCSHFGLEDWDACVSFSRLIVLCSFSELRIFCIPDQHAPVCL